MWAKRDRMGPEELRIVKVLDLENLAPSEGTDPPVPPPRPPMYASATHTVPRQENALDGKTRVDASSNSYSPDLLDSVWPLWSNRPARRIRPGSHVAGRGACFRRAGRGSCSPTPGRFKSCVPHEPPGYPPFGRHGAGWKVILAAQNEPLRSVRPATGSESAGPPGANWTERATGPS